MGGDSARAVGRQGRASQSASIIAFLVGVGGVIVGLMSGGTPMQAWDPSSVIVDRSSAVVEADPAASAESGANSSVVGDAGWRPSMIAVVGWSDDGGMAGGFGGISDHGCGGDQGSGSDILAGIGVGGRDAAVLAAALVHRPSTAVRIDHDTPGRPPQVVCSASCRRIG